MVARDTSQAIDDAAAAWVAREDRGQLSNEDQAALDVWLHADSRHAGALLRARAIGLRSEAASALGRDFDPRRFTRSTRRPPVQKSLSRRQLMAWSGGAAACVATVAAVGLILTAPTAYATERGQMRLVPLPDGSTVVLEVGHRQIETAEGSGFRIRKLEQEPIDLLVHQGVVQIGDDQIGRRDLLRSDTQITLGSGGDGRRDSLPRHVSPTVINRELAWREGKIAFEGESLGQAASAFQRYSNVRILIADPTLAREPVSGLFSANDPVGFSRAVADLFGAPIRVERTRVVVGLPQAGA
jgi:transmembrane sensor